MEYPPTPTPPYQTGQWSIRSLILVLLSGTHCHFWLEMLLLLILWSLLSSTSESLITSFLFVCVCVCVFMCICVYVRACHSYLAYPCTLCGVWNSQDAVSDWWFDLLQHTEWLCAESAHPGGEEGTKRTAGKRVRTQINRCYSMQWFLHASCVCACVCVRVCVFMRACMIVCVWMCVYLNTSVCIETLTIFL